MSKKKSEKEAKVKKQSSKKGSVKVPPPVVVPDEVAVVKPKEKKPKPRKFQAIKAVVISSEAIAMRAYFIAERREKMGWHGDSTGDWVEAERQLRAEAAKKKK